MTYESTRGRTVIFGGSGSGGALADTWELPSDQPPTLSASFAPSTPSAGSAIILAATFSGPDGGTRTFRWLQTFGPRVTLNNPTSATATFATTIATSYGFEVTAFDGREGWA